MKLPYKVILVRFLKDNAYFDEDSRHPQQPSLTNKPSISNNRIPSSRELEEAHVSRFMQKSIANAFSVSISNEPTGYVVGTDKFKIGSHNLSSKAYAYYCPTHLNPEEGQFALVYVSMLPKIVRIEKIKGVSKSHRNSASKCIAHLYTTDDVLQWEAEQTKLAEYLDIRAGLDEMKSQYDEMQMLKQMAQDNPDAAVLLERMENLYATDNGSNKLDAPIQEVPVAKESVMSGDYIEPPMHPDNLDAV